MRKLAAHYIFSIVAEPVRNGIITLSDEGEILHISQGSGNLQEEEGVEFYSGVLVPGFVNAHCHLELSHLKNQIAKGTGLPQFFRKIVGLRDKFSPGQILQAAALADAQMHAGGTSVVADISNTGTTFLLKKNSKIRYHTFIEKLCWREEDLSATVQSAKDLVHEAHAIGIPATPAPHAPYSCLPELLQALSSMAGAGGLMSVHHQEAPGEKEMFAGRGGALQDLYVAAGMTSVPDGSRTSTQYLTGYLPRDLRILLIHNTLCTEPDYEVAAAYWKNLSWVLCPSSNRYIENRLPPVEMLRKKKANIAIGTDSLSSNTGLQVVDELKVLQQNFPYISLQECLTWATLNGAKALGVDAQFGSFEVGKQPGVVLLEKLNLQQLSLTPTTTSTRLL